MPKQHPPESKYTFDWVLGDYVSTHNHRQTNKKGNAMPECEWCNHKAKSSKELEEHVWQEHFDYIMGD